MRSPSQDHSAIMHAANRAYRLARIEDYQFLRQQGETRKSAARRLGVSERTVWRYDASLREQGEAA